MWKRQQEADEARRRLAEAERELRQAEEAEKPTETG